MRASCSHDNDQLTPCRSGASPSLSLSLSLTPAVVTDRPVTPNDFPMSSACRGSASQVTPSAVHSTSLPSNRMLRTQSWCPDGPRIPRFVTTQNSCSFTKKSDIDDVTERNEVVSMYPHTELPLQMAVDARRCSTLHKSNCDHHLANREFPIHTGVSAAVHAPEQNDQLCPYQHRLLDGVPRTLFSKQSCRSVPGARQAASRQTGSVHATGCSIALGSNRCTNQQTA